MLIYRVEHKRDTSEGMYSSRTGYKLFELKGSHPCPRDDSLFVRNFEARIGKSWIFSCEMEPYLFGFASIDQFKRWVYNEEWRADLDDEGFVLVAYETEDYVLGDTQAVFLPETASKRSVLKLTEI